MVERELTYFLVVCFSHVLVVRMADIACVVQRVECWLVNKVLSENIAFMMDACDEFLDLPEVRFNYAVTMAAKHHTTFIL